MSFPYQDDLSNYLEFATSELLISGQVRYLVIIVHVADA